ncbi:uncharacterized protein I303_106619 [Kwoniella dejecticola CBS 10117]|uniref:Golgi apparatus membrane protein TVP38 n=1 Tax=Kwoniella dejecticola CBS 10117 TaxID=1296121 RepID=A0A1A5ZU65_9TREE|nr:uncharacterized protein I303_08122 [Kwoniella dejecticola CBS 10117]OBR81352.1 hypothetical protein I303_08122 [Kwoniella dejecticola CBS 10117]
MPRLEVSPTRRRNNGIFDFRNIDVKALIHRARGMPREMVHRYHKLGRKGKRHGYERPSLIIDFARSTIQATIWFITFMHLLMLALVIIITPTRIGLFFNNLGLKLREMGWKGMVLCGLFCILSSHPPLFGFMGSLTLIGFTYGMWPGALISFIASMMGSIISFISVRTFFLGYLGKNDKWEAFGNVMRAKGLPLVIMIRYCPIPWAIGNGLFASIDSVKLWHFALANLLIQPRLLIPVFIGSRLTSLTSDTKDPLQFWLNLLSIGLSSTISVVTGIIIYRLTLEQMRKLKGTGDGELAAEYIEEDALLGELSGGSDDEAEMLTRPDYNSNSRLKVVDPELGAGRGNGRRRTSGSGSESPDERELVR